MTAPKSRNLLGIDHTLSSLVVGPEPQNPAPMDLEGQTDESRVRAITDQIVTVFLNSLPSNYVSEVKGPYYVQQFQAAAEELAKIQVTLTDAYEDNDYDFTRSEVLFQFLATLVFPDAGVDGLPSLDGDVTYRDFLKRMVALLLQGSKHTSLVSGLELLTDAEVSVIERVRYTGQPGVAWTLKDQFVFDVEVSKFRKSNPTTALTVTTHYHPVTVSVAGAGVTGEAVYDSGSGPSHTHEIIDFLIQDAHGVGQSDHHHELLSDFPDLPLVLERNAGLVLQALDPAHTLYTYRNLFRETFRHVFSDSVTQFDLDQYHYEDFRHDCAGFKCIVGVTGTVLTDKYLFQDTDVSFESIRVGAPLTITSGGNTGVYTVTGVRAFPYGDDPSHTYPYTTSPTGLSGYVRVVDGMLEDVGQNFGLAAPGEILTILSGPNAGPYRLGTLAGLTGGPVGIPQGPLATIGPATRVQPAQSILRVKPKFQVSGGPFDYSVEVSRLGAQTVQTVTDEDVSSQFYLPFGPYRQIITGKGPLVRRDGTPATRMDVVVTYDGHPTVVESVNPYTGTITLGMFLCGFAPGDHTVLVTYSWLASPVVGLVGLNTEGLTLNRWDLPTGFRNVTSPTSGGHHGGFRTSRFRMGVGLGRSPRRKAPVKLAHRYMGFERGYTAALNSPTTLRLNQAPGRFTVSYAEAEVTDTTLNYDGLSGSPGYPWSSVGIFTGEGTPYTLTKSVGSGVGYWKQGLNLPISSNVALGTRISVVATSLEGVFTGVGFGFHDNRRLFFTGALTVRNPVSGVSLNHIGILARPGDLSEVTSWVVGPTAQGRIQGVRGTNVVTVPSVSMPTLFTVGGRFQVYSGGQAGTYTVQDLYQAGGVTTLVVSPAFPANPQVWGNRDVSLWFEAKWDSGPCTWRLYGDTRTNTVLVLFGGPTGGVLTLGANTLASPSEVSPDVAPEGSGQVLWGSFSRIAGNVTQWDFVRGVATPYGPAKLSRGTFVDTTMAGDPEDGPWYSLTPFGVSTLTGGKLVLDSTPGEESLGTTYGYGYTDPFLNGRRVVAFDGKLAVGFDTSGAGGAALLLRDTHRETRLGNILYQTLGTSRAIYQTPTTSLVGSVEYTSQGWGSIGADAPVAIFNGPEILLGSSTNGWELANTFGQGVSVGRSLEFRLAVTSSTPGATNRIGFSVEVSLDNRSVVLDFVSPATLAIRPNVGLPAVSVFTVPWEDHAQRTYRVDYDGVAMAELFVDGVSAGIFNVGLFPATTYKGVGIQSTPEAGSAFTANLRFLSLWDSINGVPGLGRTFGFWLGGDPTNIDNWKIPRSDGTTAPNSDAAFAVPVTMDWRSECWVRVFIDPTFGAAFIRPDLSPPPGYVGDFATESMNPSAGWVTVEYDRLPRLGVSEKFGRVQFGKLNPSASSIQVWDDVRYRVFTNTSLDYKAPTKMVLNRCNLISSGDYLKDATPEEVVIASVTTTRVSFRPCGIFADRVFTVIVDNAIVPLTTYHFNKATQVILFDTPLPSAKYPVTVIFAAGQPVSLPYLQNQPLGESQTILNEGTPPVPMSQTGSLLVVSTVSGDGGLTPAFPPAIPANPNYFLRDQYLVRQALHEVDTLYDQLTFLQLEDDGTRGLLTSLCDGGGHHELGLSGSGFTESLVEDWGSRPGIYGTVLCASGGTHEILGLIGPAVYDGPFTVPDPTPTGLEPSMTYPSGPCEGVVPGSDDGGVHRELFWVLQLGASPGSVLTQTETLPYTDTTLTETGIGTPTDQIYAGSGPANLSVSITGSLMGTAWYEMTGDASYTRVGPWTGYEEDLDVCSLMYGSSALQPTGEPTSGVGFLAAGGTPLPDPPVPVVGTINGLMFA